MLGEGGKSDDNSEHGFFSETLLQGLRKYEVSPYRVYVIGTLDQSLSSSPGGARHFRCARLLETSTVRLPPYKKIRLHANMTTM